MPWFIRILSVSGGAFLVGHILGTTFSFQVQVSSITLCLNLPQRFKPDFNVTLTLSPS